MVHSRLTTTSSVRRSSLRLAALLALVILAGLTTLAASAGAAVVAREARHIPIAAAASRTAGAARAAPRQLFHTMASPRAAAAAAGLNPTVKPFEFFLIYHSINSAELALKGFILKPFFAKQAPPIGGCLHCTGNGRFQPYTVKHNTLTETIKGTRILTARTRLSQGILRRGEIGRFKVFGVEPHNAAPFVRQQGCTAADTGITSNDLLYGRKLPLIACTAPNPHDGPSSFFNPVELSKTASLTASVSGNAHGSRWVSVIKVHGSCGANAEQSIRTSGATGVAIHVSGKFHKLVPTGKDNRAGNFCVYVQNGGKWHGVPDGRVSQRGSFPYYAGDTISITGATTAVITPPATTVTPTNTFSGFASAKETLWTFDAATKCAATAQTELAAASGVGDFKVKGLYSLNISSFPLASSFYRCAYLNVGPASGGKPTGPTVAAASVLITVT